MPAEPHGGILISRQLSESKKSEVLQEKDRYFQVTIDYDTILDVEKIANGSFSPLKGFPGTDDFNCIVEKMHLANGVPWTIPITLSVDRQTSDKLPKEEPVLLVSESGQPVALMQVSEVFVPDKDKTVKKVFGTDEREHPGVNFVYNWQEFLVAGEIELIQYSPSDMEEFDFSPAELRSMIAEKQWATCAGFQTRNVPHRAHEYLHRVALEYVDGLFLNPIIGWKKSGDFNPLVVMRAYEILCQHYYPPSYVILGGLSTAMRYAGPREAVFHAIIRKNYGCTHFIVGRDHAGVGGYYDTYAAHKIFDQFDDLGIAPLRLHGPFYCYKTEGIATEKTCNCSEEERFDISGTYIREVLKNGDTPPNYIFRKELVEYLFSLPQDVIFNP